MRNYEIMFILKPGSTDEENDKLIAAMEGVVTSHKGEMIGVEKMGKSLNNYIGLTEAPEHRQVRRGLLCSFQTECGRRVRQRVRAALAGCGHRHSLYHSACRRGPEAGRQGQSCPPEKGKKESLPENGRSCPFGNLTIEKNVTICPRRRSRRRPFRKA